MADETVATPPKKGLNLKVLMFGIPLFIIQLIAVYFITANFLLNRMQASANAQGHTSENAQKAEMKEEKPVELGKFIYTVDDLVINPSGTDGRRFLLASLGFDVASEQNNAELKEKDIVLKDAIISVMSSKTMPQLANMAYRDTLRVELTKKIKQLLPNIKVNTIYYSKYILQ